MIKRVLWSLMTLSATLVALYAISLIVLPGVRPPFIQNLFANFPGLTPIHFSTGAIAIVAGAFQFSASLRRKRLSLHRLLGRFYVGSILISGIASFVLAINSVGGIYVQTGFGLMATFWLITTFRAYQLIRQGNVKGHENWMVRSYAVTLAGVTLRLWLGLSILLGAKFSEAYPILAWACWIPNLIVAEWYLRIRDRKGKVRSNRQLSEPC